MLYDEQAELERAYAAWSEAEDASDFQAWGLSQRIVPTAMSERVIYFLTTVDRPVGNFVMEQQRIGTAFDSETGEYIDNSELFSCPPGELAPRIMELSQMSDAELTAQAEAAFSPERAVLFEDRGNSIGRTSRKRSQPSPARTAAPSIAVAVAEKLSR